jgi:DNA-directed RNA polymerase subunit RPC12/RpoP
MMRWDAYRCSNCKATVNLPTIWRAHRKGLRCFDCRGPLCPVPKRPRLLRRRHRRVS